MLSKELLSEILTDTQHMDVEKIIEVNKSGNEVYFTASVMNVNTKTYATIKRYFNIHELAHECKEWASEMEYSLDSVIEHIADIRFCIATDRLGNYKTFNDEAEPEAIFKACQWILDNKEAKS